MLPTVRYVQAPAPSNWVPARWVVFKNITVRNLTVYDTYRSAIALEAVDGGFIENIDIRNVTATNTGNAIFIRLGHRNKDAVLQYHQKYLHQQYKSNYTCRQARCRIRNGRSLTDVPTGRNACSWKIHGVSLEL